MGYAAKKRTETPTRVRRTAVKKLPSQQLRERIRTAAGKEITGLVRAVPVYEEPKSTMPAKRTRPERPFKKEQQANSRFFRRNREAFSREPRYAGKFIAIMDSQVIAVGTNDVELATEVAREHPGQPILIVEVTSHQRAQDIPSPEM